MVVSFLQSKSVNNVCKLFQLLGVFIYQTPYRGFAREPHWGDFRSTGSLG